MPKLTGIERIAAERQRQMEVEGWTPSHDDTHSNGELAKAALCYIAQQYSGRVRRVIEWWPWEPCWWKSSKDPIRNLEKAGALIAAEIDRLQRKES